MRYVMSRVAEQQDDLAYRIYISDMLRLQGEGKYLTARYIDIIRPKEIKKKEPEKTADEIAIDIISKLHLKVGEI